MFLILKRKKELEKNRALAVFGFRTNAEKADAFKMGEKGIFLTVYGKSAAYAHQKLSR